MLLIASRYHFRSEVLSLQTSRTLGMAPTACRRLEDCRQSSQAIQRKWARSDIRTPPLAKNKAPQIQPKIRANDDDPLVLYYRFLKKHEAHKMHFAEYLRSRTLQVIYDHGRWLESELTRLSL